MKRQFFLQTRDIVYIAIFLALFIIFKFIEKTIPDLPNGLGNISKIDEILLIFLALIFRPKHLFSIIFIYFLIFCSIFSGFFIPGIFYVNGNGNRFFVFILDYLIPYFLLISLSFINKKKIWITILMTFLIVLLTLISHTISGYIFFKDYIIEAKPEFKNSWAWIILWSFLLNSLGYVILIIAIVPINFIARKMQKIKIISN